MAAIPVGQLPVTASMICVSRNKELVFSGPVAPMNIDGGGFHTAGSTPADIGAVGWGSKYGGGSALCKHPAAMLANLGGILADLIVR